jgi:hypothetical protein
LLSLLPKTKPIGECEIHVTKKFIIRKKIMNQSENINELATALAKAQGEMQVAIKDCINPFFKSKYADLGAVWDVARPVLSKNGLCIMQTTEIVSDKIVMVTVLAHTSGQWIKSYLPLNPAKNDSQGVGAAITYLRRYSLSALVGVVCDDDDDGETAVGRGKVLNQSRLSQHSKNGVEKPKKETFVLDEKPIINDQQASVISELLTQLEQENLEGFLRWIKITYGCDSVRELPREIFDRCLTVINAKLKLQSEAVAV